MDVGGRVAIVTGVSSGIGRAVAVRLARGGATVVGVARRKDLLDDVIGECRSAAPESCAEPGDVSDRATDERIVRTVEQRFGRVDIVVNNAGISPGEDVVTRGADDAE